MAKIWVTGALGFIGAHLAKKLRDEGHALTLLDRANDPWSLARLKGVMGLEDQDLTTTLSCHFGVSTCETERLLTLEIPDRVYHLGAETHVDESIKNPAHFLKYNIDGTFGLLEALRKHKHARSLPSGFCLIHVSTDEVYGTLPHLGPAKFDTHSPYLPNNPYSATKAASDHLVRAWYVTYGIPSVTTHCSNNYGPWQAPDKFIPRMIQCALSENPLPVYGNGQQIRDWIHVEDHANALSMIGKSPTHGRTYLISGQCERSNVEVARAILKSTGSKSTIKHIEDRPGHDVRYSLEKGAWEAELGFERSKILEDELFELSRFAARHQAWLNDQVYL